MKNHSKTCFIKQAIAVFIFTLVCLAVPAVQATAAGRQNIGDLPIEGRYTISASIGHDRAEYHGWMTGGTIEADNTGNKFTARFGQTGVEIGTGSSSFNLRPAAWGYGDELSWLLPGVPQAVENLVSYNRGTVQEWYVNGPLGLQQGFTVIEKPKAGLGPLTIAMALVGVEAGTVDADGRGMILKKLDGGVQYRYSGLVVRDATGRDADAWMEAKADTLQICVDDVGLTYPLYIDPVIQMAKLTASDGAASDYFGSSVAISGDTVVVGAIYDDIGANIDHGAAYVFVKPAGGWATTSSFTAKLTASDGAKYDQFGDSVAISGDTVVVGALGGGNLNHGAAYVFVKGSRGWADMSQTAQLTASDGAEGDYFGYSVAISGDTVVVGAHHADISGIINQGAAYVFEKPAGGWATTSSYMAKLTASDGAADDYFGYSVAISGTRVVVGACYTGFSGKPKQGAVYVFEKPAGGWATTSSYRAKLTASDGTASDCFGFSVAISGDTVVVGAKYDDIGANIEQGSAYVFVKVRIVGVWWAQAAKLTASDGAASDYFGSSVAISGDTVVVGALGNGNLEQGAAYVFEKPAGGWATTSSFTAKLTASDGAYEDFFGESVAISGDTVVVGADYDDIGANVRQGSAYVFKVLADEPTLQATNAVFTNVTANSMNVGWTPGNGSGSIVLMKQGSAVADNPVDGIYYTANTAFGSGTQIGTGNYVIYSGNGNTVSVTGLSPATMYYVAVYAYNDASPNQASNYLTVNPARGYQITEATPSTTTTVPASTTSTTTVQLTTTTTTISDNDTKPPVVVPDSYMTFMNRQIVVDAPGVLDNDTVANGYSLTAILVTGPLNGLLNFGEDGSFTYTPDKRFTGQDSFTYKAINGVHESVPATVTISVSGRCPAASLLGENNPKLEPLRAFRDTTLAGSLVGRKFIQTYYNNADSINTALERSPALRAVARRVLEVIAPMVGKD